jgi:hypothetical protein
VSEENLSSETGPAPSADPGESHRDRQVWWILFAVGVVVFVAIVLLGRPLVAGRLTAARNLDRATAMIKDTNGELSVIDRAVRASSSTGTLEGTKDSLAKVWATRVKLEEASALSQNGFDRLTSDEQRRALIVKGMAAARLEVLVSAEMALSNGGAVNEQALRDYERAIEKVRQADTALVRL